MMDVLTSTQHGEVRTWLAGLDVPQEIHLLPSTRRQSLLESEWSEELKNGINIWGRAEMNMKRREKFGIGIVSTP
jgi:hypothetical protein